MSPGLVNIAYLVAASLFIFGLKGLSHPRTAVRGNRLGALGMLLAIVITLLDQSIVGYGIILAGIVVGGGIGAVLAVRIKMTDMPQLVALFNGFGGVASVLVAGAALLEVAVLKGTLGSIAINAQFSISTFASGLIGAITFWGSLVAFGKLQGLTNDGSVRYPGDQIVKVVLVIAILIFGYMMVIYPDSSIPYWLMVIVASVLGILFVIPIGGADMPVVVALLNSFSGLAAAAAGFILVNSVLIVAGTLVGASGIILTIVMCKAMNRSLVNVLFGTFTVTEGGPSADEVYGGKVKSTSPEEVAMLLEGAKRVCIVPGYGMAVAQAQHAVKELFDLLEGHGTTVEFGVHPVAGRMPGHMNVLLAEADIPYERLKDMDEINPGFKQVDVTIVIGANDVVNPVARTDPDSPIAGMPILDVDYSKTVVIIKRSLSPGFAGIPNPLFAADNTLMLFGDGKKMVEGIVKSLKEELG
ncbi:MAG: NAD(P)(+) transhydrogenase (Re/Si-specific) subunit beta [Candidatus Dadabacteria bacterium]|nr:NAD(P)(+) transhydrogenase (Re/Si-specific) subunit beta [Candidatus Dadabacteria bacterium]MCZ6865281.1 NAD(P)(+) transhydrogenase (Re/Si-specific) subunit beta [Candidatus Dadabacteria bacterium]